MLITQPEYQQQLRQLKDDYQALPWYQRFWFLLWSWRLARAIANIDPVNTTTENIYTLLCLSSQAWFFKSVFGLLDAFKKTTLYKWITRLSENGVLTTKNIVPNLINPFLTPKDQRAIANCCKQTRANFNTASLGSMLCTHVAKGNQSTVEAMLRKYPDLLLDRGDVTDYSDRTFKNITAFQYALWALDRHMWEAILKNVPEVPDGNEFRKDLLQQYLQVEDEGLTYTLNGQTIKGEQHFDFQPLIQALQTQADYYTQWYTQWPGAEINDHWDEMNNHWRTGVGGAQRLVPMHVVNHYCNQTPFVPTPTFKEAALKRTQTFNTWVYARKESWFFPRRRAGESRLGVDFAIYKSSGMGCAWGREQPGDWTPWSLCAGDRAAVNALCEVRTTEFGELKLRLEQALVLPQHHSVRLL